MSDVFISYAREDKGKAEVIATELSKIFDVWWDRELRTGEAFRPRILEELEKARAVIVIWSKHSVASDFVLDEASIGKQQGKLFPVRAGRVLIPLGYGQMQTRSIGTWSRLTSDAEFCSLREDLVWRLEHSAPGALSSSKVSKKRTFRRKAGAKSSVGSASTSQTYPDYVIVELRNDSAVAYSRTRFEASPERQDLARKLNEIIEDFGVRELRSHFGCPKSLIRQRVTSAPPSLRFPVSPPFALAGYVQVFPKRPGDLWELQDALQRLQERLLRSRGAVWSAYTAPRYVPAGKARGASPRRPNFQLAQGYLYSPPTGIGASSAWGLPGGTGEDVTICALEGNWKLSHEALPAGIRHVGGELIDDRSWRDHGTAALGEMVAQPGQSGIAGISHKARALVHGVVVHGVFNLAKAIVNAAAILHHGDVIFIDVQAAGPTGNYIVPQYWNDVFTAIRSATQKGITVVQPAGNGNENFDCAVYRGTGVQRDSGAIVVGAGMPPTPFFDFGEDPIWPAARKCVPRSRIWFSNYGKIVNLQGWGYHVATLGYGDAGASSAENRAYTLRFSGSSAAAAMVAGAVACIQARCKHVYGMPLAPEKLRECLTRTGSPQQAGPGAPTSQHIGPQVNLEGALRELEA